MGWDPEAQKQQAFCLAWVLDAGVTQEEGRGIWSFWTAFWWLSLGFLTVFWVFFGGIGLFHGGFPEILVDFHTVPFCFLTFYVSSSPVRKSTFDRARLEEQRGLEAIEVEPEFRKKKPPPPQGRPYRWTRWPARERPKSELSASAEGRCWKGSWK